MRTGPGYRVRKRLELFRSDLGTSTPLRACLQCIDEDRAMTPISWWRMEHQWLPTWICIRHGKALVSAPSHCYTPRLRDWHLPSEFPIEAWQKPLFTETQFDQLAVIARWTAWIVAEGAWRFDSELLRCAYHLRAKELGWVAFDGSLRFHQLRDAFRQVYEVLIPLDGMSFLQKTNSLNGGFLSSLLHEYPCAGHPLKHLYLMACLFEEPEQLLQSYEKVRDVASTDGLDGTRRLLTDTRAQLAKMVALEGRSENSVTQKFGVPPSMAIRYLKITGVEYDRRPRVLTPELQVRLQAMLTAGKDRKEITAELGIRNSFIKDYLTKQPELKLAWQEANLRNRKAYYRAHFLSVLEEHPGTPIKRIRRIKDSGFEWLYRNDQEWLKTHLPDIWSRP